jgi:hypothetical protein
MLSEYIQQLLWSADGWVDTCTHIISPTCFQFVYLQKIKSRKNKLKICIHFSKWAQPHRLIFKKTNSRVWHTLPAPGIYIVLNNQNRRDSHLVSRQNHVVWLHLTCRTDLYRLESRIRARIIEYRIRGNPQTIHIGRTQSVYIVTLPSPVTWRSKVINIVQTQPNVTLYYKNKHCYKTAKCSDPIWLSGGLQKYMKCLIYEVWVRRHWHIGRLRTENSWPSITSV